VFTQEDDAPDYTQHDLTGTFDVDMIEREIDAAEERERGSPARAGRGERRTKKQDRYDVPDFGLDGSSASRARPFVEAEGFERIVKESVKESARESRPAIPEPTVEGDVNIDEHQAILPGSQDGFSNAPEHVVADTADPTVDVLLVGGPMLSNGLVDVPEEVEDRGDKASITSGEEPSKLTQEGENDGKTKETEHEMNDKDEDNNDDVDEDNDEDEDEDDTNDDMNKDEERIRQEQQPEEQQSQTIANEEQEVTIAQPQISTITATEEVSQANAQLHAELASQLEEPGPVDEDRIGTDDTMEAFTAPQHHEENLRAAGENTHTDDHVETPSVIPKSPQAVHTLPDTMDQDVIVDHPIDLPNVASEVTSITDVSPGPDTSSIEQSGTNEETAENTTPIEENSEAELPIVGHRQLESVTDGEPDVDMVSQYAADIDVHNEGGKVTDLEDNASPIVVSEDGKIDAHDAAEDAISLEDNALPIVIREDESGSQEGAEAEHQPLSDTLMQGQHDDLRGTEDVIRPVVEPEAQEETVRAVLVVPDTDSASQPRPENEAQGSFEDASLLRDSTRFSMDESSHQETTSEMEGLGEPRLANAPGLQQHEEESGIDKDVIQAQIMLDANEEPESTTDLPGDDVTVDTTNDIVVEIARLEAMTDDQLLQEGESMLAALIEGDQQETQMSSELHATPTAMSVDTPMALLDEQTPQEPSAQRLSAFEVMQSRLNRPVKQTDDIPALTPDVVQRFEGSSSDEGMQQDEKQSSLVISVLDDSSDSEDDQVEYDDVPSVAEATSSYGSKGSEESFTGFDDEEQLGPDAATIDQDSVLGSEVDERPDPDLASFEEEPFTEFEDENEDEDEERLTPDVEQLAKPQDQNEEEHGMRSANEDTGAVKNEAPPVNGTAASDETVESQLERAEDEDKMDEVHEQALKEIEEEDLKTQGKHNDKDENDGMDENDEVDEQVYKGTAVEELKSQRKDNEIYEEDDEDDVLPELDFSRIPAFEKSLVAGLSAINDPALAPVEQDNYLPTLEDQDEQVHSQTADTHIGAHHDRGVYAVDHINHESVNGHSTHHEAMSLEQAEVEFEVSKLEPRKRSSSRKSNVPSELKGWFSPRESMQDVHKNDITSIEKEVEVSHVKGVYSGGRRSSLPSSFNADGEAHGHRRHEQQAAEPSSSAPVAGSRQTKHPGLVPPRLSDEADKLVGGLHTSLSYYTPLTDLQVHINSQHEHDSLVDVLAVVSSFTAKAKRATSGPKDHFTTFHITTPTPKVDFSPVEVQVFRPRKEVLPLADVGDVALLRNFVVRSNNGKSFLLSTAGSAWCVWRYAKKERLDLKNVGEECLGPPVEIGGEERRRAQDLSSWWKNEKSDEVDADARPVFRWSWRASD